MSLSDFVQAADESGQPLSNQYEYTLSGVTASSTLVTVYPGDGTQAVSVNGQALKSGTDNGGSVTVSIRAPETAIQVVIGNKTYTLYLTDIPTSSGGGGGGGSGSYGGASGNGGNGSGGYSSWCGYTTV